MAEIGRISVEIVRKFVMNVGRLCRDDGKLTWFTFLVNRGIKTGEG
jgi:hypothetical protein